MKKLLLASILAAALAPTALAEDCPVVTYGQFAESLAPILDRMATNTNTAEDHAHIKHVIACARQSDWIHRQRFEDLRARPLKLWQEVGGIDR